MSVEMKVDGANGASGISTIQVPNFPSNSNKSKQVLVPKPVANAMPIGQSKKQQMADIFTSSIESARDDIWQNQIVPGFVDMCANALYTFIDYMFYHGDRGGRRYSSSRYGFDTRRRTDYAGESSRQSRSKTGNDGYYDDGTSGRRYKWNEVVVTGPRQNAQRVWDVLSDKLDDQGQISVGDLFASVGWPTVFTDFNVGWTTLNGCQVVSTRDGWWFNMTKPRNLD